VTMVTERNIDLGDVQLRIAESGTGQRPLLLVHGFTGAKEDFTPWLDRLAAAGWHAVAPDLRGHGKSSKPPEESAYSFKLMADDGLGLADALGWDRFVLLGHSMGGMIAQYMAIAEPSRLAGLILMDTAHGPLGHLSPELIAGAVAVVRAEGMDALANLTAGREGPLHTPAHQKLLDDKPGYAEFCDHKLRATSPGLYAAMAPEFISAPDRLESLRELPGSLPALVIAGEQDTPFLSHSQRLTEAIGGATMTVIPQAGHSPQFENTGPWWEALTAFLRTVESG
jgi:3-oxoadipate enol-lactonase